MFSTEPTLPFFVGNLVFVQDMVRDESDQRGAASLQNKRDGFEMLKGAQLLGLLNLFGAGHKHHGHLVPPVRRHGAAGDVHQGVSFAKNFGRGR
ncbi:MAG: hypothetical protein HC902_05815 [Calothrix sp. SM1_5_4]|nr:hypothetical protein [Calothrix sp. SM1_5_4]